MSRTFCAYFIIIGMLVVATSTNVFGQTTEIELLERQLKVEQEQLNLMKYQMQMRNPLVAAGLSFTLPFALGHAYGSKSLDGWQRGLAFFGAEAALTIIGGILASNYDTETIGYVMLVVSPAVKVAEAVDSYIQAKNYNQRLQSKYQLNFAFGKEQGQIRLSYSF